MFLDLVIGAPNADTVYLYKAYPVVRVIASVTPDRNQIQTDEVTVNVKTCLHLESAYELTFSSGKRP